MGTLIILALNGGLCYLHAVEGRWGWFIFQVLVEAFIIFGIVVTIRDNIKNGM